MRLENAAVENDLRIRCVENVKRGVRSVRSGDFAGLCFAVIGDGEYRSVGSVNIMSLFASAVSNAIHRVAVEVERNSYAVEHVFGSGRVNYVGKQLNRMFCGGSEFCDCFRERIITRSVEFDDC